MKRNGNETRVNGSWKSDDASNFLGNSLVHTLVGVTSDRCFGLAVADNTTMAPHNGAQVHNILVHFLQELYT